MAKITARFQADNQMSSIIFCRTVMYRRIQVNNIPFKPIIVTSTCVRGNLETFVSIIHNLCLLILFIILKQKCNCDVRVWVIYLRPIS
jgi:hypothetical protein